MTSDTATSATETFAKRVLEDMSGANVIAMCAIGDRLGLFKDLAAHGPATSQELAGRTGVSERYAREWLSSLACAEYLKYDPETERFELPAEHAPVLAEEGGPKFAGGQFQSAAGGWKLLDRVEEVFHTGSGISLEEYDARVVEGVERRTAAWHDNLLVQKWIPSAPKLEARLRSGASVADVGCGSGRAVINMAKAFPNSRFVGFDVYEPALERARSNARAAGVDDRVRFEELGDAPDLPGEFDVITTFDVIHDTADPLGTLKAIRAALRPDSMYLMLEINCGESLEDNFGPLGAMRYATSLMHCMTTSLAAGGVGLGTMGLPPSKVQAYCEQAGFRSVTQLPIDNPLNILYLIEP